MGLRGKDFRCEVDPEQHDKLRKMADFKNIDVNALGAQFLEKMIAAEWHAFSVLLDRMESSGIVRKAADSSGAPKPRSQS